MSARPPAAPNPGRRPVAPRRKPWGWIALLILSMGTAFGAGAVTGLQVRQAGLFAGETSPVEVLSQLPAVVRGEAFARTNILLIGSDAGFTGNRRDATAPVRSDTLIVASLDPTHRSIQLLSIPRDTRVEIPGRQGFDKINAAFAYGGPELTMDTVARFLDVPIDHYVRLKLEALPELVDLLGGVEVEVEKNMRYRDRAGGLSIALKKGPQLLDGAKAEQYLRFRHDVNGDIGRVQRQQVFLRALRERLMQPSSLAMLPQLLETAYRSVETDLPFDQILRYALWAKDLQAQDLHMALVPGAFSGDRFEASYWLPDEHATRALARRTLTDQGPAPVVQAAVIAPEVKADTRISVLNGTRRTGLANEAAHLLRQDGWTVWVVGTSKRKGLAETEIAPQRGEEALIGPIAQTLGIAGKQVSSSQGDVTTDFTVIVGEDFAEALKETRSRAATSPAATKSQRN
ncbi:LCP family protein [bacterium]|nr:LCP family protein [bacterium]